MSVTLTRIEIGQQGVLPGEVLMSSTDDLTTITTPGYLKQNEGGVTLLPTDFITCVYGSPMVNKQQFNPVFNGGIITLAVVGGGGAINGVVNLGTGEPLLGVAGDNITGKTLIAGANISLTPTGTDVTIAAVGSGGGTITGIVDAGVGQGHLSGGTVGANVRVKTLVQGSDIVITENSDTVTIASTAGNNGLTNLANLPGGEGIFASLVGTVAQLKSIAAGAGISVTASGNNVIITNTGGGGGSFLYDNAQWVAKNGNDGNSGRSIDTPKLTVQAAITALGGNGIVHIEDNGTYTGAWNVGASDVTIDAPAAFLSTTGVTLASGAIFKVNSYSFGSNFNNLFPAAGNFGTIYIKAEKVRGNIGNGTNNPIQLFIEAQEITGTYLFGANLSAIINFETMAGDITDTSPGTGSPNIGVFGRNLSGNLSSTNNKIFGNLVSTNVGATIGGIGFGNFNDTIDTVAGGFSNARFIGGDLTVESQSVRTAVAGCLTNWGLSRGGELLDGFVFRMQDSGKLFTYSGNSNITVFAPSDASQPWMPAGWFVYIQQTDFSGRVAVQGETSGSGTTVVSTGGNRTQGPGATLTLNLIRGNGPASSKIYGLTGNLSSSSSLSVNILISQINGNDSTADGTPNSQFATINAALTYVIATYTANPSHGINLLITDDAAYVEQIDFSATSNINLIGREAFLTFAGPGPVLTTSNSNSFLFLGAVIASGSATAILANSSFVGNIDAINGDVDNASAQNILLQTFILNGNITNSGGGNALYQTLVRSGTDDANTEGTFTGGTNQTWTAGTGLITTAGNVQAVAGNLEAGSNGNLGRLLAFPSTANSGFFLFQANDNTANVSTTFSNQPTSIATTHAFPNLAFANVTLLATTVQQTDPNSNLIYFDTTVTAAQLAGGASVPIVATFFGGQYRVRELYINAGGTNFTLGNRLLNVTDGTTTYSIIPAAALLTLVNSRWGNANLPAPIAVGWNALTQPGLDLSVVYSGGTTDYATGSVTISGVWEKVL